MSLIPRISSTVFVYQEPSETVSDQEKKDKELIKILNSKTPIREFKSLGLKNIDSIINYFEKSLPKLTKFHSWGLLDKNLIKKSAHDISKLSQHEFKVCREASHKWLKILEKANTLTIGYLKDEDISKLHKFSKLKNLTLYSTDLTNNCINSLSKLKKLDTLNIWGSNISDLKGLNLPKLFSVTLFKCKINEPAQLTALKQSEGLLSLGLTGCPIRATAEQSIRRMLPSLVSFHLGVCSRPAKPLDKSHLTQE